MIQILTMRKELEDNGDMVDYCYYCKDSIYENEDYVKNKQGLFHLACWKQKNGVEESLNFEE